MAGRHFTTRAYKIAIGFILAFYILKNKRQKKKAALPSFSVICVIRRYLS